MKRKLNFKKAFLLSGTLLSGALTITAMSCQAPQVSEEVTTKDYDFGLASEPLNNLNYVRYRSMDRVLPSLVEPFTKQGPSQALKSIISTSSFTFSRVGTGSTTSSEFADIFKDNKDRLAENDGFGFVSGQYYPLDNFGVLGGLGRPSGNDVATQSSIYFFANPKNQNNYSAVTGYLNKGDNLWSNGDVVTAQDMRDYLEYVLDLSTGSQKLDQILKLGIRGAEAFVDAQKDYIAKFNRPYPNPWGRRPYIYSKELGRYIQDPDAKVWEYLHKDAQGNYLDKEAVDNIHKAALNFGFYTGQLFLDFGNDLVFENAASNPEFNLDDEVQEFQLKANDTDAAKTTVKLVKNEYANPYQSYENNKRLYGTLANDEYSFTLIFDGNKTPDLGYLLQQVFGALFPINRRYIETEVGGIDKYGADVSKFLTTGPFKIESTKDIVLGPQGSIILTKNPDYYDASNTISNKIKIYFSTDRTTNATFFEDGYISQTYIPANKIVSYWSDPKYKEYLNKNHGYGTIAYGFNLDTETNANSLINDPDLRSFIYYSINREHLLKVVGWDFSFPVNTWTAFGQYRLQDGKSLEMFFDGQSSRAKDEREFPLQNYDFLVHLGKSYELERTNREDATNAPATAEFYLERFKQKHPDVKVVKLNYLNNSTDEQRNAGNYLQEILNRTSNGFVQVELKSLPENTYATFTETGQYDIVYRNYDFLGGNTAQDYVASFFKTDEIDSLSQKNIAFKYNPVGSWTYNKYLSELLLEKLLNNDLIPNYEEQKASMLKNVLDLADAVYKENPEISNVLLSAQNNAEIPAKVNEVLAQFKEKALAKTSDALITNLLDNDYFVRTLLEYLSVTQPNLKVSRLDRLFEVYTYYLIDANVVSTTKNLAVKIQGTHSAKEVTLSENAQSLDVNTHKMHSLTFAEKFALATIDTAKRLNALIVPFSDYNERIHYFKNAILSLNNLTDAAKNALLAKLDKASDIEDMKDVLIEALNSNTDETQTNAVMLDYQLQTLRHWVKFIELSYRIYDKKGQNNKYTGTAEGITEYSSRLAAFFSGNFTDEEFAQGWNSNVEVFRLIALLEKMVRETVPVVPLMEVDTNWEVTKIGGISSLFRFSLQYAYDVTKPPRPGLPRKRE